MILAELMGLRRLGWLIPPHQRRGDRGWQAQDPGGGGWVVPTDQCHRSRSTVTPLVTQIGAESDVLILLSRVNPLGRFASIKLAGEGPQVVAGDNRGAATRKVCHPATRSPISPEFS